MRKIAFSLSLLAFLALYGCSENEPADKVRKDLDKLVTSWHLAATNADTSFFDYMADDAVYIGTDASERWSKMEFVDFAIPYFRRGKAWDFKTIERRVYYSDNEDVAWFDETLDTWMGVCRSSGVLQKYKDKGWKIKHYQLSCTVPNDKVKQFIELMKEKKEEQKTN